MKCSHGQPDPTEPRNHHDAASHASLGTWICMECDKERCAKCGRFDGMQICGLRCLATNTASKTYAMVSRGFRATAKITADASKAIGKETSRLGLFYLKKIAGFAKSIAFFSAAIIIGAFSFALTYSKTFGTSLNSAWLITKRVVLKLSAKSASVVITSSRTAFTVSASLINSALSLTLSIIVTLILRAVVLIENIFGHLYLTCARIYDSSTVATKTLIRFFTAASSLLADILAVAANVTASPVFLVAAIYDITSTGLRHTIPKLAYDGALAIRDVSVGVVIFPIELLKFLVRSIVLLLNTIYIALYWSVSLIASMIASQRYVFTAICNVLLAVWGFKRNRLRDSGDVLVGLVILPVELTRFLVRATVFLARVVYVATERSLSLIVAIIVRLATISTDEFLKFSAYIGALTIWIFSTIYFLIRDVTLGSMALSVGLAIFLKALAIFAVTTAATVLLWTTGTGAGVLQSLYVSFTGTIHTLLFASLASFEWIFKLIAVAMRGYLLLTSSTLRATLKALLIFIERLPQRAQNEARALKATFIDILKVRKELPIAVALLLSVISLSLVHMQVGSGMNPGEFAKELSLHLNENNTQIKTDLAATIKSLPSNKDIAKLTAPKKPTEPKPVAPKHVEIAMIKPLVIAEDNSTKAIFAEAIVLPSITKEAPLKETPTAKATTKEIAIKKVTPKKTTPTKVVRDKEIKLASIAPDTSIIPRPSIKRPDPSLLLTLTPPDITRGNTNSKKISITFDGGSNATEAAMILKTLKQKGIKTTIFLAGSFMKKYPALVRRMVRDGHEVGNHTMNHPHLTTYDKNRRHRTLNGVTKELLTEELESTARLFKSTTGREMAGLWRAPYGEVNSELRRWAFDLGYIHIGWTTDRTYKESLDTLDWVSDKGSRLYLTSGEIKDRVLGFGKDSKKGLSGGIMLMHLGTNREEKERAYNVLSEMIDGLRKRGYRFVKVSTLLPEIKKIKAFLNTNERIALNESLVRPSMPLVVGP